MDSWPGAKRIALSLVVNVEEGAERSVARGDKGMEPVDELGMVVKDPIRSYPNESNYRFGIQVGAKRVIGLLDKHGVAATWTVCGQALESAPWLGKAISARGDEAASHGYRWQFQFRMNEEEERAFIARSTNAIEKATGQRPCGWLSRYLTTDNTRRLLAEAGYVYHMDDFSAEWPFMDEDGLPIVVLPYQLDTNDMKMWSNAGYTPRQWLDYLIDSIDFLHDTTEVPVMMSVGLHLRIIGRPGRAAMLDRFLSHVSTLPDVWVTRRDAIAAHFRATAQADDQL
ncbi:MAG: polysaccharide deacetylase family protein [Gammaproteobacteria bacterium]|nr:polysaccharide deacetylase family protein [Gammaproteobacteria bacterium]